MTAAPAAAQVVAGSNVNVGGGRACTQASDPTCPAQIYGDATLQRQNEGSGACSARNPQNCLAAGNDYRLVNAGIVDGAAGGEVIGDAWLGLYWSHDGGATWRSTLLPGFPGDSSSAGVASPAYGFGAAADATVRPGVGGLLGVSGIAFNRDTSGTSGKSGIQFFSLYFDDNVPSDPDGAGPLTYADVPPRYIRTVEVDSSTSGRFLDKPWHAWDIPRPGASNTCTIPGTGSLPQQAVTAGNLYLAYATYSGGMTNPQGSIWFRSSTDCGATWSNRTKLTESVPINQSPFVGIDPRNGAIYVVWREFGSSSSPDRILVARSMDLGNSFSSASEITSLGNPGTTSSTAFDAMSLPAGTETQDLRQARSNGYPSFCVGTNGVMRVVYGQRILPGTTTVTPDGSVNGRGRIVMRTSMDGISWTDPVAVDNPADTVAGLAWHQFQPSITCTGTSATVLWYDQRNDYAFSLGRLYAPFTGGYFVDPLSALGILQTTHTMDVRTAQTDSAGTSFGASTQISRYPVAFDKATGAFIQLQYNFVNWPLFGNGKNPFIGDYADLFVRNPYKPLAGGEWAVNDFANETPVLLAMWTDNRDVLQFSPAATDAHSRLADVTATAAGDAATWSNFTAPNSECQPGVTLSWTRNQNLYAAPLSRGVLMQAEGTPRGQRRAYVVTIQNQVPADPPGPGPDGNLATSDDIPGANTSKRFSLSFGGGGDASFEFWDPDNAQCQPTSRPSFCDRVAEAVLDVAAFSGEAQAVYVRPLSSAPVTVLANEVGGGFSSSVIIMPDPNAPVAETHDISLTQLNIAGSGGTVSSSITYANPTFISPTFISPTFISPTFISNVLNPTFISPTFISPTFISPTFISPTFISPTFISPTFISPTFISPTFISPTFISPTFISPTFISQPMVTESNYQATNTGTVTSAYDIDALVNSLPVGTVFQLLVNKLSTMPGSYSCEQGVQVMQQTAVNVTSTVSGNEVGSAEGSFSLAPGEQAVVTLRVACSPTEANTACFEPSRDVSLTVASDAPNCAGDACDPVPPSVTISPAVARTTTVTVTCPESVVYTGLALEPCVATVTGEGLNAPVAVTYQNNMNAGTATATAVYEGNSGYSGSSALETFTVLKAGSSTVVTCPASVAYSGAALTPCSATVTGVGALAATLTTSYANNLNVGTATATATYAGDDNHEGSSGSASFTIGKAPSTVTITCPPSVTYTGSALTPCSATITGAALAVAAAVTYSGNTNSGLATASASYAGDTNHFGSGPVSATFAVVYGFVNVLNLPPPAGKTFGRGGNATLQWKYTTAAGVAVNSAATDLYVRVVPADGLTAKFFPPNWADNFTPQSPGNNTFQLPTAKNGYTWQFNWKLVYNDPISGKVLQLPAGSYNVTVRTRASTTDLQINPVPDAVFVVR